MTALPRGIALIINNDWFDRKLNTRTGSTEDVRQLKDLFKALDFKVETKDDLSKTKLLQELDSVARKDHSKYDCFILCLMSHGESGKVSCYDDKTETIETVDIKTVQDKFSNCATLCGKPKLFFIQACRGKKEDEGVVVMKDDTSPSPMLSPPRHGDLPVHEDKPLAPRIPPTHADFLFAYSTVDEYVSYRDPKLGSFYIRGLVKAFRDLAAHDDLLGILTSVNQSVSSEIMTLKENGRESKVRQMPEFLTRLRKKVRF